MQWVRDTDIWEEKFCLMWSKRYSQSQFVRQKPSNLRAWRYESRHQLFENLHKCPCRSEIEIVSCSNINQISLRIQTIRERTMLNVLCEFQMR